MLFRSYLRTIADGRKEVAEGATLLGLIDACIIILESYILVSQSCRDVSYRGEACILDEWTCRLLLQLAIRVGEEVGAIHFVVIVAMGIDILCPIGEITT